MRTRFNRHGRRARPAFTLMELLVVIVILLILAGIGIYVGYTVTQANKRAATLLTLKALDGMRADYFRETQSAPASLADFLTKIQALPVTESMLRGMPSRILVYTGPTVTAVKDAWSNPINFVESGNPKAPYFTSAGTDGQFGTPDDIFSYEP